MCERYITPDEAALEREWGELPRDIQYFQSFKDPAQYDTWTARDADLADLSAILHHVPDGDEFATVPEAIHVGFWWLIEFFELLGDFVGTPDRA